MKFIKLLAPLLVGGFLIMPSYATDFQTPISWADNNNGSAAVFYNNDYNDDSKVLELEISHSKSGNQNIYFNDYYYAGEFNTCKYTTTTSDSITMIFNGQAVKMMRWCKKFRNADKYYYQLTPETYRGDDYVINLFKVATSPIEIKYNNETLYFPVIGFTKAWNSAGGDAI